MPKGGKISPDQRRIWLEQYEMGKTIASIAKKAGRTERTVIDHLERARRERQHQQVQADLLRESYRDHYRHLLLLTERLAERCQTPYRGGLFVAVEMKERLLYQGLQSHTRGSEVWGEVKRWEEEVMALAEESERLERYAEKLVVQDTVESPEVVAKGVAQSLLQAASMAGQGLDPEAVEYVEDPSGATYQLRWGSFVLAEGVPDQGRLAEIVKQHRGLINRLFTSQASERLQSRWREWAEARDALQEQLTILQLRKLLPGQCNLCPAGDTGARRPPRRRRNE